MFRPLFPRNSVTRLSDEVLAALYERIATGFYNQSQVIALIAAAVVERELTPRRRVRGTSH